ncbi:hypothetical protein VTI74DRAFT_5659 [Chaetomium olivicolor]
MLIGRRADERWTHKHLTAVHWPVCKCLSSPGPGSEIPAGPGHSRLRGLFPRDGRRSEVSVRILEMDEGGLCVFLLEPKESGGGSGCGRFAWSGRPLLALLFREHVCNFHSARSRGESVGSRASCPGGCLRKPSTSSKQSTGSHNLGPLVGFFSVRHRHHCSRCLRIQPLPSVPQLLRFLRLEMRSVVWARPWQPDGDRVVLSSGNRQPAWARHAASHPADPSMNLQGCMPRSTLSQKAHPSEMASPTTVTAPNRLPAFGPWHPRSPRAGGLKEHSG